MTIELMELLISRRSVRVFEDREIEAEKIEKFLAAATHAPSAHNCQPWRFVVLNSKQTRKKIADVMNVDYKKALENAGMTEDQVAERVKNRGDRIINAGSAIMLCFNPEDMNKFPEDKKRQDGELIMGIQSTALAGGNLLLAAHAQGLGGVWTCAPLFTQSSLVQAFELPKSWLPQSLLLIGYPAEETKKKELKSIDDVVLFLE